MKKIVINECTIIDDPAYGPPGGDVNEAIEWYKNIFKNRISKQSDLNEFGNMMDSFKNMWQYFDSKL